MVSDNSFARYAEGTGRIRGFFSPNWNLTPASPANEIRTAILSDDYLSSAYQEIYSKLGSFIQTSGNGLVVEIGSGTGIGKTWIPEMICTDIIGSDQIDQIVDAALLPFNDGEVDAFVLKDAIHHLPNIPRFIDEAQRCLKVGGTILISDPYWGPLAAFIYKFLHPEPFQKNQKNWEFSSKDPWDSNQALLWIMLRRDRKLLQSRWPNLKIVELGPLQGPSYLFSGGVFGRTFFPSRMLLKMQKFEQKAGRWFNPLRLEFAVKLEKISNEKRNVSN